MTKRKLYPYHRLLQLDEELKEAIADYRFAKRRKSEAEAIRELIKLGLERAKEAA